MGITNVKDVLEYDLARFKGEIEELRRQIAEAERLIESLPAMLKRVSALEEVIEAAGKVLKFRLPDWQSESVKPMRRTAHHNPIPFGETSPTALSILRESDRPLRARDVAKEVLRRFGIEEPDRKQLDRVANSVQASFRDYKKRGGVRHTNEPGIVQKWEVIR